MHSEYFMDFLRLWKSSHAISQSQQTKHAIFFASSSSTWDYSTRQIVWELCQHTHKTENTVKDHTLTMWWFQEEACLLYADGHVFFKNVRNDRILRLSRNHSNDRYCKRKRPELEKSNGSYLLKFQISTFSQHSKIWRSLAWYHRFWMVREFDEI